MGGIGAHPADVAGQSDLSRRVKALRGRSPPTPWPHIARQVGKPEATLRAVYERGERPCASVYGIEPAAPKGLGMVQTAVLKALAKRAPQSPAMLGDACPTSAQAIHKALHALERRGLVMSIGKLDLPHGPTGWRLREDFQPGRPT